MKLFCPSVVRHMSRERFLQGGCGPQGWKIDLVPDNLLGLDIRDCCRIHDAMYSFGTDSIGVAGNEDHRNMCDRVFLNNLVRTVRGAAGQWWWTRRLRLRLARRYYGAVQIFGGPPYWDGKNTVGTFIETDCLPSNEDTR